MTAAESTGDEVNFDGYNKQLPVRPYAPVGIYRRLCERDSGWCFRPAVSMVGMLNSGVEAMCLEHLREYAQDIERYAKTFPAFLAKLTRAATRNALVKK